MWKPDAKLLEGVATLIRLDPHSYVAFGPYWWWVKRWLREAYGNEAPVRGDHDDPAARQRLLDYWGGDGRKLWEAAINHFERKATMGERYEPHSYMPPYEEAYVVQDPDVAPNLL